MNSVLNNTFWFYLFSLLDFENRLKVKNNEFAEIIKDIDEWTDVLIARIEGKKVATNTVSSTWQERLGKQIDELIEKH